MTRSSCETVSGHFDEATVRNNTHLLRPIALFDASVQMIVKSLAALLAGPVEQSLRDHRPIARSMEIYKLHQGGIFIISPNSCTGGVSQ